MTNQEFFEQYSKPGMVGLVGGSAWIDQSIMNAQKAITESGKKSYFSHAFIVGEKRADNHIWILESDLEFHRKQVKLGVQENRIQKYFDEKDYPNVAVLDFNLNAAQVQQVLGEALNLVADRTHYSLREIMGVLLSFTNKRFRNKENILAQDKAYFCSAMVQKCYSVISLQFQKDVSLKHLAPDDIYRTTLPHQIKELIRSEL